MDDPWFQKLDSRLIGELIKGKSYATQLRALLGKHTAGDPGFESVEDLATKILTTFAESISFLSSPAPGDEVCDRNPAMVGDQVGSTCSGDLTSEDSGKTSRKRSAGKDGRGCYKRRKMSKSWLITSQTTEDGFAWRKYGQKTILNTKYPRCYFRCSHKYDQGCQALRQVQRIEEDPKMFQVTYFGQHTCKDTRMNPPQIPEDSEPYLLCFESAKIIVPQSDAAAVAVKQESKDFLEARSHLSSGNNNVHNNNNKIPTLDSGVWPSPADLRLESMDTAIMLSPMVGSNYDVSSVYSCTSTSSHGLDVETLIGSVDFDDDFQFD